MWNEASWEVRINWTDKVYYPGIFICCWEDI
jgi:hypothetical protein